MQNGSLEVEHEDGADGRVVATGPVEDRLAIGNLGESEAEVDGGAEILCRGGGDDLKALVGRFRQERRELELSQTAESGHYYHHESDQGK